MRIGQIGGKKKSSVCPGPGKESSKAEEEEPEIQGKEAFGEEGKESELSQGWF